MILSHRGADQAEASHDGAWPTLHHPVTTRERNDQREARCGEHHLRELRRVVLREIECVTGRARDYLLRNREADCNAGHERGSRSRRFLHAGSISRTDSLTAKGGIALCLPPLEKWEGEPREATLSSAGEPR
jgi:hypothetical protein